MNTAEPQNKTLNTEELRKQRTRKKRAECRWSCRSKGKAEPNDEETPEGLQREGKKIVTAEQEF
jgi:hypothetical protein